MKRTLFEIITILLFVSTVYIPFSYAQDYMTMVLPEGAKARLGKGAINEVKYSPEGTILAVATTIGIWLYDAKTGEELNLLTGHTASVLSVAFSPDGQTIASGSSDATIRLWDAGTGTHIETLTVHTDPFYGGRVYSVAFSPDGNTLASGSGNPSVSGNEDATVRLWDVNTGEHIRTFTGHTDWVYSVAFSPDGNTLASGSSDETIRLWDVSTGEHIRTFTGHTSTVWSVAFSPDGNTLASRSGNPHVANEDATIRLWDAGTGTHIETLTVHINWSYNRVYSVAFSPDGNTLASASEDLWSGNGTIYLWDVSNRTYRTLTTGHTSGSVLSVAFSPDGNTLTSGSENGTIHLWDMKTGINTQTLTTGHTRWGRSAFSPDGYMFASRIYDETIRLWDVRNGTHIQMLTGHTDWVHSMAFSPDGNTLAGASKTIRLWDANTGRHIRTLTGHTSGSVLSVAFSPNGNTLASAGVDETIHLWDVSTGEHIRTFTGHTDWVNSVAFSPDGNTLASGSSDETICLWDMSNGTHIQTLEWHTSEVNSVAFSPDGNTLASGSSDNTIRLWNAGTGRLFRTLTGHTDDVENVAFSPDGNTLASGSSDNTIRLWNAGTGRLFRTLTGHTDDVESVAFLTDGNTLASASSDGTVLLWELAPKTTSSAIVRLSPSTFALPNIGEQITFSLNIAEGTNVAGYQATVQFDTTALKYIESSNSDYLPTGAFAIPTTVEGNSVTLAATSLAGESSGSGTLSTITFEVVATKASTVRLSDVLLTDSTSGSSTPQTENAEITEPTHLPEDVNKDGIVNIIDLTLVASNFGETGKNAADVNADRVVNIIDLTLVAAVFGSIAAAPIAWGRDAEITPTRVDVAAWLKQAQQLNLTDPAFQRGLLMLEHLLAILTPKATILLPNYPNPFNPETWIPYQLATPADVSIVIYAADGKLVWTLDLGHQPVGLYESRSRAAYWDGRNTLGEPVASGVYFYTLTAGEFTATRKMLIRK